MLQLFFAVAFSAVPLTLYVPPIRSLNLFVETVEDILRQTTVFTLRAYPRFRLAFSRILNSILRLTRRSNLYTCCKRKKAYKMDWIFGCAALSNMGCWSFQNNCCRSNLYTCCKRKKA